MTKARPKPSDPMAIMRRRLEPALAKTCCVSLHRDREDESSYVHIDFEHHEDAHKVFEWLEDLLCELDAEPDT